MASAGRILIIPRGTWSATNTYEMLDVVYYNGTSWIAKKDSTNVAPVDGEFWQKLFDPTEYKA